MSMGKNIFIYKGVYLLRFNIPYWNFPMTELQKIGAATEEFLCDLVRKISWTRMSDKEIQSCTLALSISCCRVTMIRMSFYTKCHCFIFFLLCRKTHPLILSLLPPAPPEDPGGVGLTPWPPAQGGTFHRLRMTPSWWEKMQGRKRKTEKNSLGIS